MSTRPQSERSDWTDQDLLTIEEADQRLRAEIADTRTQLEKAGDPAAKELLERRLRALRERAGELPAL